MAQQRGDVLGVQVCGLAEVGCAVAEVVESDGREPGPAGEGLEPDRYLLPGDAGAVLAGEDAAGVGSVRPSGEVIGGLRANNARL